MNSKDTKSSRELKNEVLQELNQVNRDLDRIESRLTPGQFIDDAIFYPVGRNPRAVFDHLKSNPIGTAFLGLGTLLLMEDDSHVTYESHVRNRTSAVYENSRYQATLLKGRVSDMKGGMNDKVSGVNNKITGVIDRTKSKVQELKGKVGKKDEVEVSGRPTPFDQSSIAGPSRVVNFADEQNNEGSGISQLKDNIGDVKDNISGKIDTLSENFSGVKENLTDRIDTLASGVKENVSSKLDTVTSDVKDSAVEQMNTVKNLDPMTYVALGAGLGALTGIALPVSDKEQMMIDQKAAGKLNEFSSEFQDALNQSVKVLKDEFLGKFTDFDINIFSGKQRQQQSNDYNAGSSI